LFVSEIGKVPLKEANLSEANTSLTINHTEERISSEASAPTLQPFYSPKTSNSVKMPSSDIFALSKEFSGIPSLL